MIGRAALIAAAAAALAGCPRIAPPPPRPHVHLVSLERTADGALRARLALDRGGARVAPSAVDWEVSAGGRPLLRGRASGLELVIRLPPPLAAALTPGGVVRLRGAVHLDGSDGPVFAPFDESRALGPERSRIHLENQR